MGAQVFRIDPLTDPRWPRLTAEHPAASVFHTRGWLRALQQTYGYEPLAVTCAQPSEALTHAIVYCVVQSRLTGNRLVSLPFSDHCEPLVHTDEQADSLCGALEDLRATQHHRYVELRSVTTPPAGEAGWSAAASYRLHRLDLRPDLEALHRRFHKDCVQRKIARAEREGLEYQAGRSEMLMTQLYELLRRTRRRHGLPPQPFGWFRALLREMGEQLCIRLALHEGRPIAGLLTLSHRTTLTYKYGGSDERDHKLGGMPLLFWRTIQEAKAAGMTELDLGRSDLDQPSLIRFKERWGAESTLLTTWRTPHAAPARPAGRYAKTLFAHMPEAVQTLAGRWLYRHVG